MKSATLTLPWPPTVNHYWLHIIIGGKPRIALGKAGKDYRVAVQAAVIEQGWPRFYEDRLAVEMIAQAPSRQRLDLDNRIKPVQDALKTAGVYADDWQIDDLRITRGEVCAGNGKLTVTLRSVESTGLYTEDS